MGGAECLTLSVLLWFPSRWWPCNRRCSLLRGYYRRPTTTKLRWLWRPIAALPVRHPSRFLDAVFVTIYEISKIKDKVVHLECLISRDLNIFSLPFMKISFYYLMGLRSTLERLEYSVPSYLHPVRSNRIVIKNNEIAYLVHFSKFCGGVYSS
jgi:hypothetical protein